MVASKTPRTFDEYLARLPEDQRGALGRLRAIIKAQIPDAEERISYGICAFHQQRMVVGFGARRGHCALYLMSRRTIADHAPLLQGYDASAGTIRFQPSAPLPAALVRRLVRARLAENAEAPSARRRERG
jgi:uncharacterized protein YdhG (YjbR/CyaY superfamily)